LNYISQVILLFPQNK